MIVSNRLNRFVRNAGFDLTKIDDPVKSYVSKFS